MTPTPAQLAILRQRYPQIGEPALRRNAALLLGAPQGITVMPVGDTVSVTSPAPKAARLRQQQGDGMNKTERAFYEKLKAENLAVMPHALTLKLGNGVRYTPDFIVVRERVLPLDNRPAYQLDAYETKGFMRDDAAVKIKVAASLYPWIKFHLVTKSRKRDGGGWQIQPIHP